MNTRKLLVSVLMLVSVLLSACAPAATPPAATAIPPTAAPTITPTKGPTTLSPSEFKIPMSVSVGSAWHVVDNLPHLFTISNYKVDIGFNIVTDAKLADPVDGHLIPFPDDFVSWIKSNPDFTTGEPTQVTVGGISGVQIDAMPIWESTTTNKKTFLDVIDTKWNILTNDGEWRFILLDNVNGERMLIMFLAGPGKTLSSILQPQEAQSILDSVEFTKLLSELSPPAGVTGSLLVTPCCLGRENQKGRGKRALMENLPPV